MIYVKPDRIPKFRSILPFVDQTRLFALHQLRYVHGRLRKITVSPLRVCHVQDAFRMLFACRGLATPFWTLDEYCANSCEFAFKYGIQYAIFV